MEKTIDKAVVEMEETTVDEAVEVKESKVKATLKKVGGGVKTHGKKAVKGAALFAGGLIIGGLAFGKKSNGDDDGCGSYVDAGNTDFVEVEETTAE